MGMHAFCGGSMGSGSLLARLSWSCGSARTMSKASQVRVQSVGGLGKVALRNYRCAAADGLNCPSAEKERGVSPQQCTYGAVNVLWVASELQRLLTMQVSYKTNALLILS